VFENGTDLATRFERAAGGAVALNGGGGEVFRNFFHLPDRAFTARELVWSFYSRLDPRAIRPPYSARAYEDAMAAKLAATAGGGAIMSRAQIEYLYPVFRCGYWMGRNNAINNRLGGALTPFIDANVVPAALAVPLALKNAGRFEAALIRAVDPKLAAYASAYGHDFAHPPPLKARAAERIGLARPPWLRRHTFRLRHRRPEPRPWFLSDAYVGRVIDLSFPCVAKLFDTARIVEAGQYNRLCTLELLCETHGLRP
jgi:asparagine synthase (glutamine-hydrolysing)